MVLSVQWLNSQDKKGIIASINHPSETALIFNEADT